MLLSFTPKISGRPGRTLTCEKIISKPSHSSSDRVKSFSPTLAPPETRIRLKAEDSKVKVSINFLAASKSSGRCSCTSSQLEFARSPRIKIELLSRICPGLGDCSGGTISSPVVKCATRNRGLTSGCAQPAVTSNANFPASKRAPVCMSGCPTFTSSPRLRMFSAFSCFRIFIRSPLRSTFSCMMTRKFSYGDGAPVAILTASPDFNSRGFQSAA